MVKTLTWLGVIFVAVCLFFFGYSVGRIPTTDEQYADNLQTEASQDLLFVSSKYKQLGDLCEQKYQTGISGDLETALQIKGQMGEIQSSIDARLAKYSTDSI